MPFVVKRLQTAALLVVLGPTRSAAFVAMRPRAGAQSAASRSPRFVALLAALRDVFFTPRGLRRELRTGAVGSFGVARTCATRERGWVGGVACVHGRGVGRGWGG